MNETFDEGAWERHREAIWGGRQWPSEAVMSICSGVTPSGRVELLHPDDRDGLARALRKTVLDLDNAWASVAGLDKTTIAKGGRGKRSDVIGMPALVADLDIAGPNHKSDNLPQRAEVDEWIASLGIEATVITHTGGGLHLWCRTRDLIDPHTPEGHALLQAWKQKWQTIAAASDRHIDIGITADPSRIMRAAGTLNVKSTPTPITLLKADPSIEFDTADLLHRLSPLAPLPTVIDLAPAPRAAQSRAQSNQSSAEIADRVGDRFSARFAVGDLLTEHFNVRRVGGGLVFPRPDGSFSDEANARLFADPDGIERFTIFGERVRAEWARHGANEDHSWSAFDLLAKFKFGGNFKSAAGSAARIGDI